MARKPTKVPARAPKKNEKRVSGRPRKPRRARTKSNSSEELFDTSPPSEETIDELSSAAEANLIGRISREGKLY